MDWADTVKRETNKSEADRRIDFMEKGGDWQAACSHLTYFCEFFGENEQLFGFDPTPAIVAVEFSDGDMVDVFLREKDGTTRLQ